jgi:hypothetical protein
MAMTRDDILQPVLRRKIRAVISQHTPAADAIFEIAATGRENWTATDWLKVLQQLDQCELTVADWLLTQ